MNVRKLKFDMWRELETGSSTKQARVVGDGEENSPPGDVLSPHQKKRVSNQGHEEDENTTTKSFQSLIKDINQQPGAQQKDASLSFYFICLLHLANEKVLIFMILICDDHLLICVCLFSEFVYQR